MNKIEEIAAGFTAVFCLNDESVEDVLASYSSGYFREITRCVPQLLYQRVNHHDYDIVFIHKDVLLNESLQDSIEKIKIYHPKTIILVECEDSDSERILTAIKMNIDKTILSSMDNDAFCKQIERIIAPRFELDLNARYEKHLEKIISGKTKELQTKEYIDTLTGFKNGEALKELFYN